jgi:hypothetical protein
MQSVIDRNIIMRRIPVYPLKDSLKPLSHSKKPPEFTIKVTGKGTDKVHTRTDHEGIEREWRYSFTHSMTSALGVGGS